MHTTLSITRQFWSQSCSWGFAEVSSNPCITASTRLILPGICAGKRSVADYLVKQHGFYRVSLLSIEASNGMPRKTANEDLPFHDIDALLDFVTKRWRERWVIRDISSERTLDALLRRPWFLLVSVDAPVSVRWRRYKARSATSGKKPQSLEDFVLQNDQQLFEASTGLAHLMDRAQLRLLNASDSLLDLKSALDVVDLTNEQRLRPSWDQYFMQLASLAAHRSNCMKRRVGCVLVREKRVISTGYNGTPRNIRNCNEGGCES